MTKNFNHSSKLNIAIAGIGFGAKVHLPALQGSEHLNAKALWHPDKNKLMKICKRNEFNQYSQWADLINDKDIQGIIIATPPKPRYQLAIEALNAGKHLLLEKPVALNSYEIEALQKLAITKRLVVGVDFEYRAVPLFIQAKRILDSRGIGDPWFVKLDWLMSSRANKSRPWNWYSDKEQGGGVIGALGTHAIDTLHWFIGNTINVSSLISTCINDRPNSNSLETKKVTSDDICLAQLELKHLASNSVIPCQVSLSSVAKGGRGYWIEIYGSEGSLVLGSSNQNDYVHGFSLYYSRNGEKQLTVSPDSDLTFKRSWTDGRVAPVQRIQDWWGESIIQNKPMIPGLSEGLLSQKVCDKIIESAQSNLTIQID